MERVEVKKVPYLLGQLSLHAARGTARFFKDVFGGYSVFFEMPDASDEFKDALKESFFKRKSDGP